MFPLVSYTGHSSGDEFLVSSIAASAFWSSEAPGIGPFPSFPLGGWCSSTRARTERQSR